MNHIRLITSLLGIVLLCQNADSQVSSAYRTQIESIFQNVNRTYVTTGLRSDYGLTLTNIEKFSWVFSDTNYIEQKEWGGL